MEQELIISYRDFPKSDAVDETIRDRVEKLEHFFGRITSCRVVVSQNHHGHNKGNHYQVTVDLHVPGQNIVVSRDPKAKGDADDIYVVIRDAFDATERKLKEHAAKMHDHSKQDSIRTVNREMEEMAEEESES